MKNNDTKCVWCGRRAAYTWKHLGMRMYACAIHKGAARDDGRPAVRLRAPGRPKHSYSAK